MGNLKEMTEKEISEIYAMISSEITKMTEIIEKKTGRYVESVFSIFDDSVKGCLDIDIDIALLEKPHEAYENKVQYYMKVNPDNVLNKPIIAYQHNSWYMIYDGVHRTEANARLGKKTIKAQIIIPDPKK